MAQARPALQRAINEILERHGVNGKRMSYRQAERLTGLSPATIGELAKGNARTPETIRRFARGLGEDANRLLLLAGFVPEEAEMRPAPKPPSALTEAASLEEMEPDEREWLGRLGRALARMPPGRERNLWKARLRQDAELIEAFLERLEREGAPERTGADGKSSS